jgi:hypothetical protein
VEYPADKWPLSLPTFPHNERFAENRFEGLSLPPAGIETFALSDLLHQYRVAQYIQGIFQALLLVVIDQNGGGFAVAGDDDLLFPLPHSGDELGQTCLDFRYGHDFGHGKDSF